ncbi:MAG: hypothetical protein HQ553_04025 [Chloroflexi bacterium]|nr:hypothetical protein [Chloroflexota bacterium]
MSDKTKHRFVIPPTRKAKLIAPKGSGSTVINLSFDPPTAIVRKPGGSPERYTNLSPYVSLDISFEVSTLNPSIYDVSVLDGIHQFVSKEVFPRFTGFF